MKNKGPVIIIDGDHMLHRAYYKFQGFTSKEGDSSSIIFGVPYLIRPLLIRFKPSRVICVFDGGRNKIRTDILPTYKQREHKEDFDVDAYIAQKAEVMVLVTALGCQVVHEKGQEADDLIYSVAHSLAGNKLIIVSSDKDFHQLISDTVSVYSPAKEALLTTENLGRFFVYKNAQEALDFLILNGDKSDKIPGLRGMGEKRIRAFLDEFISIRLFLFTMRKFPETKTKYNPLEFSSVYKRNRLLMDLGYFWRKHNRYAVWSYNVKKPIFDMILIAKIARKYNSKTLVRTDFLQSFKELAG